MKKNKVFLHFLRRMTPSLLKRVYIYKPWPIARIFTASPFFLVRVHGDATGPESGDEEKATDDGHRLKEVVLQEIAHGPVRRNHPERVQVHVQNRKPQNQHERRQLRPVDAILING